MHIKRIQVEEGFLDGLDLQLPPGLVTLIGARGTGKTSVIELIRFCLGVPGLSAAVTATGTNHALAILGDGQVTITLDDGGSEIIVTRAKSDSSPRRSANYNLPIIFSQTEIETIGLHAVGRLTIIDGFLPGQEFARREEDAVVSEIRSLTAEIMKLRKEVDDLQSRRAELPRIEAELHAVTEQEQRLAAMSDEMKKRTELLTEVSARISATDVGSQEVKSFLDTIISMRNNLHAALGYFEQINPWSPFARDVIAPQKFRLDASAEAVRALISELSSIFDDTAERLSINQKNKVPLEEDARRLRREIDALSEGSGAIVRSAQNLRAQKSQIDALSNMLSARQERVTAISAQREEALKRLDLLRHARSEAREVVIEGLNNELGPRIRLVLDRSAQYETFAIVIAEALKGSGLKYNELALTIARAISPRELAECIEGNDVGLIAELADTSKDRALKIISSLKDADVGAIATTLVEDDVSFQLLDGTDYKDIRDLSTGQRCTVILPIVLKHTERLLIVDQPEDHIDNAFIAETLIMAIRKRSQKGQIIFSTHNANIPVLGEADCVVEMGSDGRRGFAKSCAPLDAKVTVTAITDVMEGGAIAFNARAKFYKLGTT